MRLKKKIQRICTGIIVLTLLCGISTPVFAVEQDVESGKTDFSDGFSEDPNAYEIYPVPHYTEYLTEQNKFTMTSTVTVVAEEGVDEYTLAFLKEILEKYNLNMFVSDQINSATTNILLGIKESGEGVDTRISDPKHYTDLFTAQEKYDPYILEASTSQNPNGVISILGLNTDCVYYGVETLQMMFTSFAGKYFLPVYIEDYSDTMIRGFIEGFYGEFDYEERENQMWAVRDVKANMYTFASKDDYYHGSGWNVLYPEEGELQNIAHLVEVGKQTKVRYCWSVHIGLGGVLTGITKNTDAFYTKVGQLLAKFEQLYDVGVRDFHVLNDDYNSGTHECVAAFLNEINAWLKGKGDCGPLVYCPNAYFQSTSAKTELSD